MQEQVHDWISLGPDIKALVVMLEQHIDIGIFHGIALLIGLDQGYCLSSSHVWMWELDHKEGWVPNNWCFWTVVLEKTLESLLDCKEIKLVNPKRNQPWILLGRTDVEAEASILWLTWGELLTHWKRSWCWERLKAEEEGDRGWDSWMASPIRWTWTWENSKKWWRAGRPGVLQSMGCRFGYDLATVQQQQTN